MHFVYCLYSPSSGKHYIGRTSDLTGRLQAHNHPSNKGYTKRYQPWQLVYHEECPTLEEAGRRERFFKSGAGRDFLRKILTV